MSSPNLKPKIPTKIQNESNENHASTSRRENPYTITEAMLKRRLQHESKGRYITQLCIAISASLGALSFGISLGWSSPATRYVINTTISHYNISQSQYAWVGSLMPLGCSVGIVPWRYSVAKIGPKHTVIIQTPFYILTWLMMIMVQRMDALLVGRFFSGFLCIANLIGGECLLMDCVHKGNLGHMLVFFRSSIFLGVLTAYSVGHHFSKERMMIICAAIPGANLALLALLPESPVFLYTKSEVKAEEALTWYRGRANICMEMRCLKKDAELRRVDNESNQYMLYSKVVVKAMTVILGLIFFQVFSGYFAFIFYALLIWEEAGVGMDPYVQITVFALFLYFANFFANMFHYHVHLGVRKPLLFSTILTAMILTILAVYMSLLEIEYISPRHFDWIPFIILNMFVVSYETGLGSYADILLFNYLPYQVLTSAGSIAQVWFWVQIFVLTKYFITLKMYTSMATTLGVLALISHLSIAYCYWFVVESKGKNLIQIQLEIGGNPIGNRGAFRQRFLERTSMSERVSISV